MPQPTPYHEVPYVGDIDFTTNPPTRRNRYTPPPSANTPAQNDATSTVGAQLPPRPRGPHAPTPLDAIIHDYFNDGYGLTDLAEIHAIPIAQLLEIFDSPEVAARINRITAIADRRARNIATVKAHQAIAILNNIACTDQSSRPETARRAAHALLNAADIPLPKSRATKPTTPSHSSDRSAPPDGTSLPTDGSLGSTGLSLGGTGLPLGGTGLQTGVGGAAAVIHHNVLPRNTALPTVPLLGGTALPTGAGGGGAAAVAVHKPATPPLNTPPLNHSVTPSNNTDHTPAPPKLSPQSPLPTPPTPSPSIPESPTPPSPTPQRITPWSPSPTPAASSPPPKRKQPKSASP